MKSILNAVAVSALAMLLTSCTLLGTPTGESDDSEDDKTLTLATYGGAYGEAIKKNIIEPFQQQTGIAVREEVGVSGVTLGKIRQPNSGIDVAFMDGGVSEQAERLGAIEPFDMSKLPHTKELLPEAVYKDAGSTYAIGISYYALGLVYNTEEITQEPKSWNDLWRPEYQGKITAPSMANAMGLPFMEQIGKANGGTSNDPTVAVERLQQLKVSSYYDTAGASENLFTGRDAVIGAGYASSAFSLASKNQPYKYVVPTEGAIAGDIRLHQVKGTKKADAVTQFIDFAITQEPQLGMARALSSAPSNAKVQIPTDLAPKMPYGENGSIKDLTIPDWFAINDQRQVWTDRFNQEVLR